MSISIKNLNTEQKEWYAQTVIAAILADNKINWAEVSFLKQVISIISNPKKKKELIQLVSQRKAIPVSKPPAMSYSLQATVFTELILIILCDLDFDRDEMKFLEKTSDLFGFSDKYYQELMDWAKSILDWKKFQYRFVPDANNGLSIPIKVLNSEQKNWYASLLISTIMLDGQIETIEVNIMMSALTMVESSRMQNKLKKYIRNKIQLPVNAPPVFPPHVLTRIYLEIISILSADDIITYQEQFFLKELAQKCNLSIEQSDEILDWCNSGILWKKARKTLIKKCQSILEKDIKTGVVTSRQNRKFNSIIDRYYHCYICESKQNVTLYHLKLNSHVEDFNIFGVRTYQSSKTGYNFIDYIHSMTTICPTCYFASLDKRMFCRKDEPSFFPILSDEKFKANWLKESEKIKEPIKKVSDDLFKVDRSPTASVFALNTALKCLTLMDTAIPNFEIKWGKIEILLTLAEIITHNGNRLNGDQFLQKALKIASAIFTSSNNRLMLVPIKCARLLFMFALYSNNVSQADEYMTFFSQIQLEKTNDSEQNDVPTINMIISEVKSAYFRRDDFLKSNLENYHLKELITTEATSSETTQPEK